MKTEEVSNHSAQTPAVNSKSPLWKRRAVVTTSVLLSILGTGVCLAPTALTTTSLRNRVLDSAIDNDELTATAESATGGWFAPLVFQGVQIQSRDDRFSWAVDQIQTSKGLLSFITDSAHVGDIRLTGSVVKVRLDDQGQWPVKTPFKPSNSELSFRIEKGSLEISVPWRDVPIVELSELTIAGNIARESNGKRTLNIDPITVLDHEPLSESHTQQNLALIAPVLSQATQLTGSASVWLDEMHIPLHQGDVSKTSTGLAADNHDSSENKPTIKGRAEFHSLEARLKESWTRQLTAIIGQISGTAIPSQIQVLKNSTVEFSISDNGIHHEGMVFLLPELAKEMTITSSGSVHLDETIDLLLALKVPSIVPAGRPFLAVLSQITSAPIQLRVLGTVSEPRLQLPEGVDLISKFSNQVAPAQHLDESRPLPSAVLDLIQDVGSQDREQAKKDLPGSILNLIRAIDQQAKEKQSKRKTRRK